MRCPPDFLLRKRRVADVLDETAALHWWPGLLPNEGRTRSP